ncbi:MAG: hypothetical protein Q9209_006384 [Squamulea sp. 1 TL-2023]
MLVVIIAAATSSPRKHINPSCYVGVMISAVAGLASVIIIYIKYKERKKSLASKAFRPPTSPSHSIELGHLPPPMTISRGIVSNWEDLQSRHPLRSMMVSRNLPSASARIAGSNGHPRVLGCLNLPPAQSRGQQHRQNDSTSTAAALQRFLDHELQRQEAVKRRISIWLGSLSPDLQLLDPRLPAHQLPSRPVQLLLPPDYPPPPPPISRTRQSEPPTPRTPRDPVRLAELTKEIEAYLGFPAPPLAGERNPYTEWGVRDEEAVFSGNASLKRMGRKEKFDGDEVSLDTEDGIDYSNLPPAIPRIGAHGRDPMLSDPITVLHVGPIKEGVAQQGSPLRNEGLKKEVQTGLRGGGYGGSFVDVGREERDSFAERWIRRMVRGVDVERKVGSAGGMVKKGKGLKWWKLW